MGRAVRAEAGAGVLTAVMENLDHDLWRAGVGIPYSRGVETAWKCRQILQDFTHSSGETSTIQAVMERHRDCI